MYLLLQLASSSNLRCDNKILQCDDLCLHNRKIIQCHVFSSFLLHMDFAFVRVMSLILDCVDLTVFVLYAERM